MCFCVDLIPIKVFDGISNGLTREKSLKKTLNKLKPSSRVWDLGFKQGTSWISRANISLTLFMENIDWLKILT
jgi:hypothetical protein